MRYITRPLTPEARVRLKGVARTGSPFQSSWNGTLVLLDRELTALGVSGEFVLQIDCTEDDLKLNGELRSNARPASPSVAIAVDRKKGPLLFVCGRFQHWQDNVRAIALGLEALRKIERYGIVQADEQYTGWQALPPGTAMPAAKMTVDEAERFLSNASVLPIGEIRTAQGLTRAFRDAARTMHPDAGGDPAEFRKLTEARDLLEAQR